MKNVLTKLAATAALALLFVVVQACNQTVKDKDQEQELMEHPHEESLDKNDSHDHGSHDEDRLTLNNGAKWQDDEPTNKNANIIISIGDQFEKDDTRTLEDYNAFGNEVIEAINIMIRECTMKGEADLALHFWFAPILHQAEALKEATDTTGLSEIASEMIDRMRVYHDYFE